MHPKDWAAAKAAAAGLAAARAAAAFAQSKKLIELLAAAKI